MKRAYWLGYDVVVVLAFAGIGRASHDEGLTIGGWAHTAWPFLVGLLVGWLLTRLVRTAPGGVRGAMVIWLSTVAVGMVVRVITGAGTAVAFVIVALVFLGLFLLGGRAVATLVARRSAVRD